MFILPTQLLVLPPEQAHMQEAPKASTLPGELDPVIAAAVTSSIAARSGNSVETLPSSPNAASALASSLLTPLPNYQPTSFQSASFQSASFQSASQPAASLQPASPKWPVGGAIAGTAVVSAGIAAVLVGEQPITVPVGEALISPVPTIEQPLNGGLGLQGTGARAEDSARDYARAIATGNTSGINPTVALSQQVGFSQLQTSPHASHLTYAYPSSSTQHGAATQAIVRQLLPSSSDSPLACTASTCKSLEYIEKVLPEAQQTVQEAQRRLDAFSAQHGQSNMQAYQQVLTDRITEISGQKSQTVIDLSETQRYIDQLKVRLSTLNVTPDLAKHLLATDAGYQASWLQLKQVERQLLEEFSAANVDGTALNGIYTTYEDRQMTLYQSAQAVLGNYLLAFEDPAIAASNSQVSTSQISTLYQAPAAIDLLQALAVATHQRDVQQLRLETARIAESRLRSHQSNLANNIGKYEALQRELASAQALVTQYERTRTEIAADAIATAQAVNAARTRVALQAQSDEPVAAAKVLQASVSEGSIAKTLLGIVVGVGMMAVAAQRKAGDVSEALILEISPQQQKGPLSAGSLAHGSFSGSALPVAKRLANPLRADLLSELLEITGHSESARTTQKPAFSSGRALMSATTNAQATENALAVEAMSHELTQALWENTPEGSFAKTVSDRAIEPVKLSLSELDDFAENAVRWVLQADLKKDKVQVANADGVEHREKVTPVIRPTIRNRG